MHSYRHLITSLHISNHFFPQQIPSKRSRWKDWQWDQEQLVEPKVQNINRCWQRYPLSFTPESRLEAVGNSSALGMVLHSWFEGNNVSPASTSTIVGWGGARKAKKKTLAIVEKKISYYLNLDWIASVMTWWSFIPAHDEPLIIRRHRYLTSLRMLNVQYRRIGKEKNKEH